MAAYPSLSAAGEKASVILDEAEALLDPVSDIEGFMLACLVDASTGMVLASRKDRDDIGLPHGGSRGGGHRQLGGVCIPLVTVTIPPTSGWRNRPGCIRAR
jgi:hypothetical protein